MNNPWTKLGKKFVLPEDAALLPRDKENADPRFKLQLQLPPVPYIGNPATARVVILAKNPGYAETNDDEYQREPLLKKECIRSLMFESRCPFFFLDSRFKGTDGYEWWDKVLRDVFDACYQRGVERERVLERISCVQWHPYHSARFKHPLPAESRMTTRHLPSQEYSFHLVNQAIKNKSQFVLLWGNENERLWRGSVPKLPTRTIRLRSSQTPRLSRGNMNEADFEKVVAALCGEK